MTQPHLTSVSPFNRMLLGAVLAAGLVAAGCGGNEAAQRPAPPPVPVTVGTVEVKTVPVSFRAIGHVEPIETVAVKARIGGELQAIHFTEGETVAAGDLLFTIDPRPYRAALAQAEAELARNRALLAKAEADIVRYTDLVEQDFVTREQFDQITANAAALRAAVAAGEAAVDTARLNLDYCAVKAPIGGRTGNLQLRTGALVKANDDRGMVTINRMRPIHVAFSVPAQLLVQVQAGRKDGVRVLATLPGDGETSVEGRLTFVDNAVDSATATILLKATFPNADERLWPGQFVDLEVIVASEADRLVCPAAAVQTGQQGQHVFAVRDDGTVEQRPVTVVRSDEHQAVIGDGLTAGETVVTDGQLRLVTGAKVAVRGAAGAAGSGP